MHGPEHVDFVLLRAKHFLKNRVRENAEKPRDDLLARLVVGAGEKLGFKKSARHVVQAFDHVFEFFPVFDKVVKSENVGLVDCQHGPRQIGENNALLLGEFRAQQRGENVAVEFENAVENFLFFRLLEVGETVQVVIEQVERDGVGEVVRVDE